MKWPISGSFWAMTPQLLQIWSDLAETFTTGSTKEYKNSVWWIFEKMQIFPETGDTQSLMVWIGENKKIQDKNSGYPDLSTPTS